VDRLTSTTAASGVPISAVSSELTEHLERYPTLQHVNFLQRLRNEEFGIVLDDFGSGWSHIASGS